MTSEPGEPTVASVGEAALLAEILPLLPGADRHLIGPGDDSAVLGTPDGRVVVSSDMMIEGPDFRWDWSQPEQVGFKAIASNAADIAAMGAIPVAFQLAVATPLDTPVSVLRRLANGISQGITELAPASGVSGGDVSVSPVFTIAVTVLGDLEHRAPVTRSGAKTGNIVAVAGELGLSHKGLVRLRQAGGDPDALRALRRSDASVMHHLAPRPPIWLGPVAADAGATAMMDISDGLVLDASRMAIASGVDIELDARYANDDDALFGGEDHGLLATFPATTELPEGFYEVGRVTGASKNPRVVVPGRDLTGRLGGWDPFHDFRANQSVVSP